MVEDMLNSIILSQHCVSELQISVKIFQRQTQHTTMPRITQGNAKESLLATVTKFTEVTGEQVGLVFTWKGKIVVIGKEPFKELINEHRRDVQKSLFTFSSSTGSNHPHPTPTPPEVDNSEMIALLNSNIDPWSFSVERLRKLLNFAIRTSMGEYFVYASL